MTSFVRRQDAKASLPGSHLRQVAAAESSLIDDNHGSETDDSRATASGHNASVPEKQPIKYVCNLNIHDAAFSKDDILVNLHLFAPNTVAPGDLMHVRDIQCSSHNQNSRERANNLLDTDGKQLFDLGEHRLGSNHAYLFRVKPMPFEMISKNPDLQLTVSSQTASAFHLAKGSQAELSPVDKANCAASHVEIIFRDQYLARADMWRLVSSELTEKCLHRGQRIVFLGNIKATVKSLFINGRKAQSAHFTSLTKPIFRSESARYVLFIQMSKEMWDFDAEGTGEIMFDKVINGFLPDLFRRWQEMRARHLLSIILFSRMIYENQPADKKGSTPAIEDPSMQPKASPMDSKDFYRVVVSDMPSGESADILNQLKKEFKVFLRDTSLQKPEPGAYAPLGSGLSGASTDMPTQLIAGHPSTAAHGNVLEAINLATSQFSSDYIDRDLVRTGVSIVVISPGTGLFEVDYDLLAATTDNLVDNGVGIDLVCLSRMPLHSVPLFQYKQPQDQLRAKQKQRNNATPLSNQSLGTPSPSSLSPGSYQIGPNLFHKWSYGIPHWVDVSFWNSSDEDRQQAQKKLPKSKLKPEELHGPWHKPFIPRVKLYELQMMGTMDNAEREISIPQLLLADGFAASRLGRVSTTLSISEPRRSQDIPSGSFENRAYHLGAASAMLSTTSKASHSKTSGAANSFVHKMDEYDDLLFRHPRASHRRRPQKRPKQRLPRDTQSSRQAAHFELDKSALGIKQDIDENPHGAAESQIDYSRQNSVSDRANVVATSNETGGTPTKSGAMPRSISFGSRGLTPKAIATATAKVDVTQSPAWSTTVSKGKPRHGLSTFSTKQDISTLSASSLRPYSDQDPNLTQSSDSDRQDSRPIPIRNTTSIRLNKDGLSKVSSTSTNRKHDVHDRVAALSDLREADAPPLNVDYGETIQSLTPVLSPKTTLAPWLTILNPSNPSKTKLAETSRLGRWQHIFPRAPKTSQMKWKSLCSPAAVPLTTEEFPTSDELEEEYKRDSYVVTLPEEMDLSEHPHSLVQELLAFRLSRGFQIVVGDRLAESQPTAAMNAEKVFCEKILGDVNSTVFLSRGSTLHRMTRSGLNRLEIEVLTRHSVAANDKKAEEKPMSYKPVIRSMLADMYEPQEISIAPQRGSFNWDLIDAFIAGHERPQAAQYVENLRPWRARFVLIPVDPPSSVRRNARPSEDNEEEIRLEGIRKLTQLWQRFRYVPPDERGYQPQVRKSKDPNPLDISYQTKNPSAVIAAELESVLEGDETGRPVQLLPEPDLYQRSNLNIKTLAETLQGEKGVRMLDRRWHWRLHYNCFIGFELTTWLLQNFRDIGTREEAEELGKELMKSGLFKHVEQRHDFRDGNYFYQIEAEYRTPRPESKGWFGRGKSSVPATPAAEQPATEPPRNTRSRASSNADATSDLNSSIYTEKKQQLRVALSKSLFYDVDHRRRSYRPELINLHYDRLHNPDNCYHIRVEWMNTTPRLIQEAVISWATNVDRFGLRLVEVPIGEASSITAMHPFRAPYKITLAQPPPTNQPQHYFDATAFVPQLKSDPLFYQKAIMRHFNFVLDFEAASSFPPDVEVSYSWGKPDYRYPQYIHRSGLLIAQITDEGQFLLLANRLYNNRNTGANLSHQEPAPPASDSQTERLSNLYRASPHRATQRSSSRPSPFSSPAVRATGANLDVPPTPTAHRGPSPAATLAAGSFLARSGATTTTFASPEQITRDFQTFCSDPAALDAFYTEVLSKAATPASTPFLNAAANNSNNINNINSKSPLRKARAAAEGESEGEGESEHEIPSLDLPSSVFGAGKSLASPPSSAAAARREREGLRQEVKDAMKAEMRRVEAKRLSGGAGSVAGGEVDEEEEEEEEEF